MFQERKREKKVRENAKGNRGKNVTICESGYKAYGCPLCYCYPFNLSISLKLFQNKKFCFPKSLLEENTEHLYHLV